MFFQGPIPEAIAAAQARNGILLVYIAGTDEASLKLERITWRDPKVIEEISQQCIALHLLEGSSDAVHFSALYPVSKLPVVTLVGHNGLLLRQHEGYISPEEFLDLLGQCVFHMQDVAAHTIVTALASAGVHSSTPVAPEGFHDPIQREGPLSEEISQMPLPSNISRTSAAATIFENSKGLMEASSSSSKVCKEPNNNHTSAIGSVNIGNSSEQDSAATIGSNIQSVAVIQNTFLHTEEATWISSNAENVKSKTLVGAVNSSDNNNLNIGVSSGSKKLVCGNAESVQLQVRLTDGENIRGEFVTKDYLSMVRDFVDRNRTDGNCDYFMALPYPRRVFDDEDMKKTLLELKIESRATLILISKQSFPQASETRDHIMATSSSKSDGPASGGLWKFLSYLNPFSYFGGNTSTHGNSGWQYGPNPVLERALRDASASERQAQDSTFSGLSNPSGVQGRTISDRNYNTQQKGWGGNVHTLRDDENDMFGRGNSYWNGNSTQFTGDNSKMD
eukprot:c23284_g1_i1 orf=332-1849(-)